MQAYLRYLHLERSGFFDGEDSFEKDKDIIVIELTICYEANTQKANDYKRNKYSDLRNDITLQCDNLRLVFLEVTSLGFINDNIKISKYWQENLSWAIIDSLKNAWELL